MAADFGDGEYPKCEISQKSSRKEWRCSMRTDEGSYFENARRKKAVYIHPHHLPYSTVKPNNRLLQGVFKTIFLFKFLKSALRNVGQ
jgi:hypothetical protein